MTSPLLLAYRYTLSTTGSSSSKRKRRRSFSLNRGMKTHSFLIFLLLLCSSSLLLVHVNSQSDSCTSNFDLKSQLLFNTTTSLICQPVWDAHGFILRYEQTRTGLWSFILSAPNTNAYIGIAFSSNGKMVGSSSMVAWVSADGTSQIKQYRLDGTSVNKVLVDQGNLPLVGNTSSVISKSSIIYMAFQLNTTQPQNRPLYAVGPAGRLPVAPGFQLAEHHSYVSTSLDYTTGVSKSKGTSSKLKKTHGILSMLGWGVILPVGVLVARHMKAWDPTWFYAHSVLQSFGFIFGLSGIIAGFALDDPVGVDVDRHKGLGVFIIILGCLQMIAFLVRPGKDSKVRKYWNWYHWNVGRFLIILAVANVFYGVHLAHGGSAWTAGYAIFIAIFIVVAFLLELRYWFTK